MSDHTTPIFDDMDDAELIVTYLQGRLPPDRAEADRQRLEEEDAFVRRTDSPTGRPLPYDSAWVTIGDGVQVQLTPGASLRKRPEPYFGRQWVLLDGTARFHGEARDSAPEIIKPTADPRKQ